MREELRHRRRAAVLAVTAVVLALAALLAVSATATAPSSGTSPIGAYRLANGNLASIVMSYGRLRLMEYWNGAFRGLSEQSPNVYVGGPGVSVLTPVQIHVRLLAGGGISVDGVTGRPLPFVSETAAYQDGPVRIVGRLLRPPGNGPFPAVVIVPGSEPAHRDTYDLWAYFFAAQGFAVLTYDKRGVGDSGGRYDATATPGNLRLLASDVLAGVQWLGRQASVDASRIGLAGGSQAGWVIELAASRSSAVRWAALQSGPAMSVGRQLAYSRLTKHGWANPPPTDQQIAAGLAHARNSGYDPRVAIASLKIPVLWQLGSVDKRMYTPETLADLKAIEAAGSHDFTVHVYPGGAHSLRLTAHGLIREEQASPGFVPGVFPDLATWLKSHVLAGH